MGKELWSMRKLFNRFAASLTCKAFQVREDVSEAVAELKSDERGLSGVVVAILLILVAVLAVVLIWGFLGDYLQDVFDRITAADTI